MNPSYSATFIVRPLLKSIDEKTYIGSFHNNRAIKNSNRNYPVECVCLWNGAVIIISGFIQYYILVFVYVVVFDVQMDG